jgi:hypothetical protein
MPGLPDAQRAGWSFTPRRPRAVIPRGIPRKAGKSMGSFPKVTSGLLAALCPAGWVWASMPGLPACPAGWGGPHHQRAAGASPHHLAHCAWSRSSGLLVGHSPTRLPAPSRQPGRRSPARVNGNHPFLPAMDCRNGRPLCWHPCQQPAGLASRLLLVAKRKPRKKQAFRPAGASRKQVPVRSIRAAGDFAQLAGRSAHAYPHQPAGNPPTARWSPVVFTSCSPLNTPSSPLVITGFTRL